MTTSIKLLVNISELRYLNTILQEKFPYINMFVSNGLNSLIDCLMTIYELTEHDQLIFIEEVMNVIDTCISEYSEVYEVESVHSDAAITELYSYEFSCYINSLYNVINDHMNNLLTSKFFIVKNFNSYDRLTKIYMELYIDG